MLIEGDFVQSTSDFLIQEEVYTVWSDFWQADQFSLSDLNMQKAENCL